MSHYAYYLLIITALAVNWGDKRAVALSTVIGVSLLLPVNKFTTWQNFYIVCALFEILITLLAVHINTRASDFIMVLSLMLCAFHFLGWWLDGYPPNSPYRPLVKIAEYAEIIACILFAKPLLRLLNHATSRNIRRR